MKSDWPGNSNLIYEKLRQYREDADLSQKQLAEKMQQAGVPISQSAISRIEGNLRYVLDYELLGFCLVLQVRPEDLMP